MEEESRQKTDRKRMLGLLTVSCAATLCFAGLYVQELKTVEKLESAGQWTDTEELNALRADYSAAISRAELAEQEQEERTQVNDLITAFLNAYFLLPDSREALLSGCEEYVSEDAWRTIELLSDSRDYNDSAQKTPAGRKNVRGMNAPITNNATIIPTGFSSGIVGFSWPDVLQNAVIRCIALLFQEKHFR